MDNNTSEKCKRCEEERSLEGFYLKAHEKDKHQSHCKHCGDECYNEYVVNNKDHVREYQINYYKNNKENVVKHYEKNKDNILKKIHCKCVQIW